MTSLSTIRLVTAGFLSGAILVACATVERSMPPVVEKMAVAEEPASLAPEVRGLSRYRALAIQFELSDQHRKALLMWEAVEELSGGDPEARSKIRDLKEFLLNAGERHYARAIALAKSGPAEAVEKNLLLALVYDPERKDALALLKQRVLEADYGSYEARQGETAATVAARIYGDPAMAPVVIYFNNLAPEDRFLRTTLLRLPVPEKEGATTKAGRNARTKARSPIRAYDRNGAEQHYAAGVAYYLEQKLQAAVREWEEALRLYPDHPNAKRDIQKVRTLLKKEPSK